jgi:hypothetical protein
MAENEKKGLNEERRPIRSNAFEEEHQHIYEERRHARENLILAKKSMSNRNKEDPSCLMVKFKK